MFNVESYVDIKKITAISNRQKDNQINKMSYNEKKEEKRRKEKCSVKDLEDFAITCNGRKDINFRESLIIVDPQGVKVGDIVVSVEGDDSLSPEILVHVQNHQRIGDNDYGMSVTSRLKRTLSTVEEVRKEWKVGKEGRCERQLFLAEMGNYYYISWTKKLPSGVKRESREVSFEKAKNLVSEGANIVLLRTLAHSNFGGKLFFKAILMNGKLFESCYGVTPLSESLLMAFKKRELSVIKVVRTITVFSKLGVESEKVLYTYLTKEGFIFSHEWNDSQFKMCIDPNARLGLDAVSGMVNRVPLHKRWQEDMQLQSLYKVRITQLTASYKSYLLDYPQIQHLISDFMLNLLLVKPLRPIQFAMEYFATFRIPSDEENVETHPSIIQL